MIVREHCLVCGSKDLNSRFTCTDNLVSHRDFTIISCKQCGFMFTQGVPGSKEMDSYYDSPEYISHTGGRRTFTDILYGLARGIMLHSKTRSVKRLTEKDIGTILDIGAGTGHFLKSMKENKWAVSGVEVNKNAREYAHKINGVELKETIDLLASQTESFDAVTLWHVLEHIHEPEEYLNSIFRLTKLGGLLLIAVPNTESADASHYIEKWAAWDVPRHLWHFNNSSIKTLVERNGFRLVSTARMPFDSFYISILSEKNRNSRLPILKGLVKGFFFWIQSLLSRKKSSSLIYSFIKT